MTAVMGDRGLLDVDPGDDLRGGWRDPRGAAGPQPRCGPTRILVLVLLAIFLVTSTGISGYGGASPVPATSSR